MAKNLAVYILCSVIKNGEVVVVTDLKEANIDRFSPLQLYLVCGSCYLSHVNMTVYL